MGDLYYSGVVVLVPFNGTNNSTVFKDYGSGLTVTNVSSTIISDAYDMYNGTCGYFSGTSYLNLAANYYTSIGTADFTIEGFVRVSSTSANVLAANVNVMTTSGRGWIFYSRNASGKLQFTAYRTSGILNYTSTNNVPLNTIVHLAVTRTGGRLRGFIDGVLEFDSAVGTEHNYTDYSYPRIGASGGSTPGSITPAGYIGPFRITNGYARYTTAFTVPTPETDFVDQQEYEFNYVKSNVGSGSPGSGTHRDFWQATTAYAIGDKVSPPIATANSSVGFMFECTVSGTSGGSAPTFVITTPNVSTTTDNTVTWLCRPITSWSNAAVHLYQPVKKLGYQNIENVKVLIDSTYSKTVTSNSNDISYRDYALISVDVTDGETPTESTFGATLTTTTDTNAGTNCTFGEICAEGIHFNFIRDYFDGPSEYSVYGQINNCVIEFGTGSDVNSIFVCDSDTYYNNSFFKFSQTQQYLKLHSPSSLNRSYLVKSGGFSSGTVTPTVGAIRCLYGKLYGFDFSTLSTTATMFQTYLNSLYSNYRIPEVVESNTILGCKFPTNWTGNLFNNASTENKNIYDPFTIEASEIGITSYEKMHSYCGNFVKEFTIKTEDDLDLAGNSYSWKLTTNANINSLHPRYFLTTLEFGIWNTTTNASISVQLEFLHDSLTDLTTNDLYFDVSVMEDSASQLVSLKTNKTSILGSGSSTHTSSTKTWTTTGLTNPRKQKLVVSCTPQQVGLLTARVFVKKANYTIYLNSSLTLV